MPQNTTRTLFNSSEMKPKMTLEIRFGIPKNQRTEVAKIFYESFGSKFNLMFGNKQKAISLVASSLDDKKTVVALKNGLVVGYAGLHYFNKSYMEINLHKVVKIFGLATFRVILVGGFFLLTKVGSKELHLESLAVSSKHRNQGIGHKLLQFTVDYGRSKKFSQIHLEVIQTNPKAKRLYERIGFKEVKVQKVPFPFSNLLGFSSITQMVYKL